MMTVLAKIKVNLNKEFTSILRKIKVKREGRDVNLKECCKMTKILRVGT